MNEKDTSSLAELRSILPPQRPLETLIRCQNFSGPIFLMPAGQSALCFLRYLREHSISVTGFIDNSPTKQGTVADGIPVVSLDEFERLKTKALLVIATNEKIEDALRRQLRERGIRDYCCSVADHICYSTNEIDNARNIILQRETDYVKLYKLLEDDLSRQTLIARLQYLVAYDENLLKPVVRPLANQYFEPSIYAVSSRDVFVDCGAFDGDTFEALVKTVNAPLEGYYGFEPDERNFSRLVERTRDHFWANVYCKGVHRENAVLRFLPANTASQINASGSITVEAVSLDTMFEQKRVTFIKMDVEGAECDVLAGARSIIARQRPVLAVSVYHRYDHLCDVPFFINKLNNGYRYFLRHYTLRSPETVLYAVPR